ncbi:unnamed protein product [Rhodiola kirilowii]
MGDPFRERFGDFAMDRFDFHSQHEYCSRSFARLCRVEDS